MDDKIKEIINNKIDDVINNSDEIIHITNVLHELIENKEQTAFGIALGRIYNAFHYQTRRILKRNATDEEFNQFVELLSKRTEEIKSALRACIK